MPAANGGAVSHPGTCRVPKIEERIANADLHRLMPCPWIRRSPDAGRGGQLLDKKVLTLEAARKIVTLTQRAWREDFAVVIGVAIRWQAETFRAKLLAKQSSLGTLFENDDHGP
jgi:DNA-binding transcriptional regulator PaaX